ncbi:type I glutamate--ammonia ligase [Candidatus Poribacteria bacterium]|nr:type I glutamate--ammonia ligase [Candidatus Poribacteria bacterium]
MTLIEEKGIKLVDFKFVDLIGVWQHFTVPIGDVSEGVFEDGLGFDGSSIRGWANIHESDMLLMPDPNTAIVDPFNEAPTLSLTGNIVDPVTKGVYNRDPRDVAKNAESYLKSTKIADTAYFGPELEFFIFDDIRYNQNQNSGYYFIDSDEGVWNTGREEGPNLGYKIRNKEGYFPVPPTDTQQDIRNEMVLLMEICGIKIERQHHEVATAGQAEIDMRFQSLLSMADTTMLYKYIVKNIARRHSKVATFMPKPLFGDNGSGMHTHQSLWKNGKPLFAGDGYAGLSEMALYYIGGLLKHAPALTAITNPTMNSYKRLVPGFEAPVNLAYSSRNRSASIRIPMYSANPKAKRVEFRCPDPTCNPYLAFAAMLMAGLDGIQNKIDPGKPLDKDIYDLPAAELKKIPCTPGSLEDAIKALENDHSFLLKGNVFSKDLIEIWINIKKKEIQSVNSRPHPYEFHLYFDL